MRESDFLIVTGGYVDCIWAKQWLENVQKDGRFGYIIAADSGLKAASNLGLSVNHILGDYDSLEPGVIEKYHDISVVETFPKEKDYTDTHLAINTAIRLGAKRVFILGATGGNRIDHMFTSVSNMMECLEVGIPCYIIDQYNKLYLCDEKSGCVTVNKKEQHGEYVSFFPLTKQVVITLKGFKYELKDYCLTQGLSICQSNEVASDVENAEILIKSGVVIVFESKDK